MKNAMRDELIALLVGAAYKRGGGAGLCEYMADHLIANGVEIPVRCQNCNWWHRHKSGDLSCGVCDKYAMSKSENGYCDEPLLEERKYPWKN